MSCRPAFSPSRRGRSRRTLVGAAFVGVLLVVTTACSTSAAPAPPPGGPAAAPAPDQFTTVVPTTLDRGSSAVSSTDGMLHTVYEVQLTNAKPVPATLSQVQVLDAAQPARVLATVAGPQLAQQMRDLTGKTLAGPDIPPFTARLVLMDLVTPPTAPPPAQLLHRFLLTGATITGGDTPGPLDYTGAPYAVSGTPVDLSPPLRGAGWVNFNGCCSPDSVHRNAILPVNGHLADTQRFAVDYMRLDPQGQLVNGDPADYRNYTAFGADVLAVADATVVATLDNLPEQVPGSLPDPATITLETVDGNHVILDLGDGRYAFYAHLQPGSVRVQAGQRVTRGQPLGLLGNTGNTSAPHLHFHVMDGPSVLGSSGLPFTIDTFSLAGRIDPAQYNAAQDLTGVWNRGLFPAPQPLTRTYPLGLDLINFPG